MNSNASQSLIAEYIDLLFDKPIVCLIIICFTLGILCALRSMWQVRFIYRKQLELFKKELPAKLKATKEEKGRMAALQAWLEQNDPSKTFKKNNNGKLDSLNYSPLYMRVYSLYRALADDNGARQLPQLHDLRELALQDEMSRFSAATLRTIISFLLIVGIFGTLFGVHSVIESWDLYKPDGLKVSDLTPALEPSMFAVAGTVLLMWLRGVYSHFLQRYLLELDQITMEELLPRLQPESSTQTSSIGIDANIKNIATSMGKMAAELDKLGGTIDALKSKVEPYQEYSQRLQELKNNTEATATKLSKKQNKQSKQLSDAEAIIKTYQQDELARQKESAETLRSYREAASKVREAYKQLTAQSTDSLKQLNGNVEMMQRLAETARNIPRYANNIRKYVEDIDKTVEHRGNIDEAWVIIDRQRITMESLSNEAYELAKQADASLNSANEYLSGMTGIDSKYNDALRANDRKLNTTYEQMKTTAKDLKKSNDELFEVFKNRKNDITKSSAS